ncbi:MAG: methionine--tRNA ligase, partial [Candidatus Babeliales bacterium]
MNKNKFYITTPIYYVNAKPHLGTLYTTVLADILARWHKLIGKKVFFLTGTDEHGQKIQERAESLNMTPQALCDSTVPEFKKTWHRYEIGYDKFIRTTDPEHVKAVQAWVTKMQELGDIYKSHYTGLYCVPCERFINNTTDLLFDQDKKQLCPMCKRHLIEMAEESYFFRLSAYQDQLIDFYEQHPDFVTPKERLNEIISFVKSDLKDLSISRKTVSWGIPFPGDPSHTVYVWGDALNNYLSAIGCWGTDAADKKNCDFWWPADVHLMAKDIVRFHAVYWPAFLMAAQLPLPKKLLVHGYIMMGDQKMSKSLGNAIDPETLAYRYGVEQIRYYLARQLPVNQDGQFSIKDVEERISADLANNLGNLLNRTTSLALANGLATVTPQQTLETSSTAIKEKAEEMFRIFSEEMNKSSLHIALAELWKFISEVNAYFHTQQPWVLAKTNKELFAEVIHTTCQSLQAIGIALWPFMPTKMDQLLSSIGQTFTLGTTYEAQLRKNTW